MNRRSFLGALAAALPFASAAKRAASTPAPAPIAIPADDILSLATREVPAPLVSIEPGWEVTEVRTVTHEYRDGIHRTSEHTWPLKSRACSSARRSARL